MAKLTRNKNADEVLEELHEKVNHGEWVTSRTGKKYVRQPERLVVRISPFVWDVIEPLFTERKGSPYIVAVACDLNLHETMRLISEEPQEAPGIRNHQLFITPTDRLLERAQRLFVTPHVLCRAAAVKIMHAMTKVEEEQKRGPGRPRQDFGKPIPFDPDHLDDFQPDTPFPILHTEADPDEEQEKEVVL